MSDYLIKKIQIDLFNDELVTLFINGVKAVLGSPMKHNDLLRFECDPTVRFMLTVI